MPTMSSYCTHIIHMDLISKMRSSPASNGSHCYFPYCKHFTICLSHTQKLTHSVFKYNVFRLIQRTHTEWNREKGNRAHVEGKASDLCTLMAFNMGSHLCNASIIMAFQMSRPLFNSVKCTAK